MRLRQPIGGAVPIFEVTRVIPECDVPGAVSVDYLCKAGEGTPGIGYVFADEAMQDAEHGNPVSNQKWSAVRVPAGEAPSCGADPVEGTVPRFRKGGFQTGSVRGRRHAIELTGEGLRSERGGGGVEPVVIEPFAEARRQNDPRVDAGRYVMGGFHGP